jgi:hypothetical protein
MNAELRNEQSLLVRVEKLERENTLLKRTGAVVLLVVSVVLLTGQAKQGRPAGQVTITPDSPVPRANPSQKQVLRVGTIQANTIEVLPGEESSAKGFSSVPVLRIVASPVGSELTMFDGDGKARVSLSVSGSLGQLRMGSSVTLQGLENLGTLHLSNPTGKETAIIAASDTGPFISLISDTPHLLLGRDGGYRTEIGSTGLVTATGRPYDTSAASVVLIDPKGNLIWSAEQAQKLQPLIDYFGAEIQSMRLKLDDTDDSKKQLEEFKDAACPILRTARADWSVRSKLDSACRLH